MAKDPSMLIMLAEKFFLRRVIQDRAIHLRIRITGSVSSTHLGLH